MRLDSMSRRQREADFNAFSAFIAKAESKCENHTNTNTGSPHLAMVYPVRQDFCSLYDPEIALVNGTIFSQLHKPFMRSGCGNKRQNGGEGCL